MATRTQAASAFGRRLAALRRRAGLSLRDLEKTTGMTRGGLSKLERGKREPSFASVCLIADALGIGIEEFR